MSSLSLPVTGSPRAATSTHARIDPNTWYDASAPALAPFPALSGDLRADVCVVGGGFLGLSTALHLAEAGYDVVLLEARALGDGASGRNGGLALPGFTATNAELVAATNPATARRLWDLSVEAVDRVKRRIERHAIACDLKSGVLTAAVATGHARQLARDAGTLRRDYGYDGLELLSAEEARRLVRSDRYQGGVLDRGAAHLHPLAFLRGLAGAAQAAGVRIFEHSPANAVESDRVIGPTGSVAATHVVLAANVGIGALSHGLRRTVLPLRTFMIATEPLGQERAARVIPGDVAVYDTQVALNYFRMSNDHRLLFGGGITAGPRPRAWIERHLQKAMTEVFPQLSDLRIDFAWSGALDMTANRMIQAGRTPDGLWHAQGFSGHGVALTLRVGEALADAICGKDADLSVLAEARHRPIPGGRRLAPVTMPLGILWEKLRRLAVNDGFYSL